LPDDLARARQLLLRLRLHGAGLGPLRRRRLLPRLRRIHAGAMGEALTRAVAIPFLDLGRVNAPHAAALREASERVLASGRYVLGPEVEAFEGEFAAYCDAAHAVGVANGLDAL